MATDTNASQLYAVFRNHAIENESKSRREGRPIFDDMVVCDIYMAGNKQTVGCFPAHEFAEWQEDPSGYRKQVTYAEKYAAQYAAFEANGVQSASGTPLSLLPFLTEGQRLELKAINIHTAEALAGLDGAALKRVGAGGRNLKNKAQAYLDTAAGATVLDAQRKMIEDLQAEVAALKAGGAGKKAATGKKAKAEKSDEDQVEDDEPNPFAEYDADDIRAWISDSDASRLPPEGTSQEDLAKIAKEINDEFARKKAAG